ncbi:DUF1552 domain-containing protein [Blastopirellula marina]|uniref:DUF1552 domain-containing protein n=1 Tax=Blastopirellula marina DSM 3645 TaxID=314230 RepID=A3ZPP9_9BACT|nr:DUF1552 domain-containing protein [Blastopirellula marina]EAQ81727.1 hypothetical protein DSM3645_29137 [Blastopirellula marina DSM 3645]
MLNRRNLLQSAAMGAGAAFCSSLSLNIAKAAAAPQSSPKRIIFFLQNQGFDPATCVPAGLKSSASLADVTLPEPISPLEPHKHKIHIINGLHGRHTSPSHSAYFGALGGYRGGIGVAASAETIDHVVSQRLPETILPHLCIGMDALENMVSRPTLATLSATGAGQPIFMHSNPNDLYQMLFGGIATGDVKRRFEARSKVLRQVERLASNGGKTLPERDRDLYRSYVDGFREMNGLRQRLGEVSDHLQKFAPVYGDKFLKPKFETDWHDSLLDIGIAALQAGLTNTLTIGSGRGEIFGSWKGLGVVEAGHNLGHMEQPDNPIWIKIRQYNCQMLVKLMESLEAMPEGNGTMMDNTLIVYTSNNADKQHTGGANWPFILLGNCGGRLKTGQFTQLDGKRPINALYTTLLHAIAAPRDRFNMDDSAARTLDPKVGPIEELFA